MAQETISFEQFLNTVNTDYQDFIQDLHVYLTNNECKAKFEQKSSGYFVSYSHAKSKKSIANLLFRKKGMMVRIYGEHASEYVDFLNTLPEDMVQSVEEALVCKRLIDPSACNPKCSMGYDFTIENKRFQKCKNGSFVFFISKANNPYIKSFIEHEIKERTAG